MVETNEIRIITIKPPTMFSRDGTPMYHNGEFSSVADVVLNRRDYDGPLFSVLRFHVPKKDGTTCYAEGRLWLKVLSDSQITGSLLVPVSPASFTPDTCEVSMEVFPIKFF